MAIVLDSCVIIFVTNLALIFPVFHDYPEWYFTIMIQRRALGFKATVSNQLLSSPAINYFLSVEH